MQQATTNVQTFQEKHSELDKENWIAEFMQEFDVDYPWAEYKYNQIAQQVSK